MYPIHDVGAAVVVQEVCDNGWFGLKGLDG